MYRVSFMLGGAGFLDHQQYQHNISIYILHSEKECVVCSLQCICELNLRNEQREWMSPSLRKISSFQLRLRTLQKRSHHPMPTPRKINGWNLRIWAPWKRKFIFQTIIFRFFVNLRGGVGKQRLEIHPRQMPNPISPCKSSNR